MKTKKGNVAVIAIIVVIVAITAGVVGYLFAKNESIVLRKSSQEPLSDRQSTQNSKGQAQDVFYGQGSNSRGEVVFGPIEYTTRVYQAEVGNKRKLMVSHQGTERMITEVEFDKNDQISASNSYGNFRFSSRGNYVIFSQFGWGPAGDDIYSIARGVVSDIDICGASGFEMTPDEKYFYVWSSPGYCSGTDLIVYNAGDFTERFNLAKYLNLSEGEVYDVQVTDSINENNEKYLFISLTNSYAEDEEKRNSVMNFSYYFDTNKIEKD